MEGDHERRTEQLKANRENRRDSEPREVGRPQTEDIGPTRWQPEARQGPAPGEVIVRRRLLDQLKTYQQDLFKYARAYIESKERDAILAKVWNMLVLAPYQGERMKDYQFWMTVCDNILSVRPFPEIVTPQDFNDEPNNFGDALRTARERANAALINLQGFDHEAVRVEFTRQIQAMQDAAGGIAEQCKEKSREMEMKIQNCITQIFERIDTPEEPDSESYARSGSDETRRELKGIEPGREPRPRAGMEAPGAVERPANRGGID